MVELIYTEQRMLDWHEGGWDPWLDVNMPRPKDCPPELAELFRLLEIHRDVEFLTESMHS